MRREKNKLYFRPDENEKFLRAIALVGKLRGFTEEGERGTVEHERAHIEKAEELGCFDKIEGYVIEMNTKRKYGLFRRKDGYAAAVIIPQGISKQDRVRIVMAPERPSIEDFVAAVMQFDYFGKEWDRLNRVVRERGDMSEYRADLVARASTLAV